jgi:hypothetical protein
LETKKQKNKNWLDHCQNLGWRNKKYLDMVWTNEKAECTSTEEPRKSTSGFQTAIREMLVVSTYTRWIIVWWIVFYSIKSLEKTKLFRWHSFDIAFEEKDRTYKSFGSSASGSIVTE